MVVSSRDPVDVQRIAGAIREVARGIVAAEESASDPYPDAPVAAPPLAPTPAYLRVIERAGLDDLDTLALRILVAAELDRHVHRLVRRLSADTRLLATPVDGMVAVLEGMGVDPVTALGVFRPEAPLVATGVVEVRDAAAQPIAQHVALAPAILTYLVTGVTPPPSRPLVLEPARPAAELCPLPVRDAARDDDALAHVRRAFDHGLARAPLWLVGAPGMGRRTLLAAVAAERGQRLLCVPQAALQRLGIDAAVALLRRELVLGDAVICVHDAEAVVEAGGPEDAVRRGVVDHGLLALSAALVEAGVPVAFCGAHPPPVSAFEHGLQLVVLAPARVEHAIALWRRDLAEVPEVVDLASRFRLAPGRIVRAVQAARARAASHARAVDAADVARAISVGVSQQVAVLGTLVEDTQTWDDIILPAETLEAVREMIARVRHRHQVLDEWGFRAKLAKGLGVAALFHGPPGTGKTMVANLIAKELRQDLYQVDLSRMVSKWIGETEKNLAKVFDAAEGANVMLLFDEADALFSKRTEVKSSNDRHSNAEVNYLLQRVERFEGVCILTTNLETSIDQAFKRRLAFRIEFPMPDERERATLWRRMVPAQARIAEDVDHEALAHRYEIAGGNIRNALLRAAFLAAVAGTPITMELLQRAVQLEYRDAGKLAAQGSIYGR